MRVRTAVHLTSTDTGASECRGENRTPMVTTTLGIDLRCPTKFSNGDNQCLIKQAALIKVFNQRSVTHIKKRTKYIFKSIMILCMCVPQWVI